MRRKTVKRSVLIKLFAMAALLALLSWGATSCAPAEEAEEAPPAEEATTEDDAGTETPEAEGETEAEESESEAGMEAGSGGEITTESGLKYIDLAPGSGDAAKTGSTVTVHYTGWLEDGTKFDSSLDAGEPFTLTLGEGRVIAGWEEGLLGMKAGGKRKLIIPGHLGYGERGYPGVIPPNSMLIFEVEVLEIQ